MKRPIFAATLCLMTMAGSAQETLTILHTNDSHSTVMPLNKNLADTLKAGRGGFLRRLAMVEEERDKTPDLLLFDSGDFSQGSPYYALFGGEVEVGLMNRMHYDAAVIGNHEFDGGMDNLVKLLKMAEFPILCANYDFTGTPAEGLVKQYTVIERDGVRIGVFGLSPVLEGLVAAENYVGVTYRDPIESAKDVVATLRGKEGCDVVICLSHIGWEMGDDEFDDNKLVAATTGIDLVLGGHSHTYLNKLEMVDNAEGRPVPVNQNGKHSIFVGKIVMTLE